jgi:hypothetical protein
MEDKTGKNEIVAVSTAAYRRVAIIETAAGCTFFWNSKRYDCKNLGEATAAIDAIYSMVSNVVIGAEEPAHAQ